MSAHDDMIEDADESKRASDEAAKRGVETDERDGRPSASIMERLSLCPGSLALSRGICDEGSPEATRGNRIHALVAGEKVENPTAEEKSVAAQCEELAQNVIESTFGVPIQDCDEVWIERRLWSNDKRFSGKPDLVVMSGGNALIVDYKTGGGEVAGASINNQLRALAVLVQQNTVRDIRSITVAIIQPLASRRISVCKYNKAAVRMATNEVAVIITSADRSGAPRYAGARQCKYCPARTRCPEASESLKVMAKTIDTITAEQLTSAQMAEALNRCEQAESVIDAIREEAKLRLSHGEELQGWALRPQKGRETVKDATEVYSRFLLSGGTHEAFLGAVSISKTSLKEVLKDATLAKGKELDAKLGALIEGCTEETGTSFRLVREKPVGEWVNKQTIGNK